MSHIFSTHKKKVCARIRDILMMTKCSVLNTLDFSTHLTSVNINRFDHLNIV